MNVQLHESLEKISLEINPSQTLSSTDRLEPSQEDDQECGGTDRVDTSQVDSTEEENLNQNQERHNKPIGTKFFSYSDDNSSSNSASSYAGSGDLGKRQPAEFVPSEYLTEAFLNSVDLTELDKAIVIQTKTSALINAKTTEVEKLRQGAISRLTNLRKLFQDGARNLRQTEKDLTWASKKVKLLQARMKTDHPIEYNKAVTKICERDNVDY
ncbi:hypothetical protein NADFUDRAFT_51103 [Nadsonia fulvescens var. elongata DSM 6958]|uniref:Biogenesis of lysosome-related organelles complex 1 subunit KXD1 n=1 Tax=Nadsonia fulvescens var. elongata DSM 6958 TaxID=857566 RepID=A0A1E3PK63_9ASCO|nr:hypothetical protein NADFUDRAFT_51103 [Nadsonia fulvescens var. elongata DSM 6958]